MRCIPRPIMFVMLGMLLTPILHAATNKSEVIPLDRIVAVVNDDVITSLELNQRIKVIKQRLQQKRTPLPPDDVLSKQILERLVVEKLELQLAKQTGVRVNDEMVNQVVGNIARQNNLTLPQFRDILHRDGFEFAEFRESIRNEMIINQLRKLRVESRVAISEQEIENHLERLQKEKGVETEYHLGHILIAVPEAATPAQIEQAQKKAETTLAKLRSGADFSQTAVAVSNDELALKGGDLGWRKLGQLPTLFADTITAMKPGEVEGPMRSPSGFHIVKLMDKRSETKRHIVQQTLARHILIQPTELLSNQDAQQRLATLRERILAGADFATLARANSADKASAVEGGSLGWVNPGMMVPQFEEEMNKLQPGEISQPFQTQYGWHIVQVMSRRQHDNTDEYQRSQAYQLIRKRKTEEAIQDWLRQLRAEAYVEYRFNQ